MITNEQIEEARNIVENLNCRTWDELADAAETVLQALDEHEQIEANLRDERREANRQGRIDAYREMQQFALYQFQVATTLAERDAWSEIADMARAGMALSEATA